MPGTRILPGMALDSTVKLALPMRGPDTSTFFEDLSASHRQITAYGNAQQSATVKLFGQNTCILDGSGDYLSIPDSDDFYFGTDPFSFSIWLNAISLGTTNGIYNQENGTSWVDIRYSTAASRYLYFEVYNAGSSVVSLKSGSPLSTGVWHWLLVNRVGNLFTMFLDGANVNQATATGELPNIAANPYIGTNRALNAYWNGYIADPVIRKGSAIGGTVVPQRRII